MTHPLLTHERTALEIAQLENLIGAFRGPVLDLGCGFGRHSIALAERGVDVVGIDPSTTMIAHATERANSAGLSVSFVAQPAHEFDGQQRFLEAICLFTSFGQRDPFATIPSSDSTGGLLDAAHASLVVGAPLVIEVPELERSHQLLALDEQLGPTHVTRQIDATGLVNETFDGPDGEFHLGYQAFTEAQLTELVRDGGFDVESVLPHGLASPPGHLMTVIARNRR